MGERAETCDSCGVVVTEWTIAKGFDLRPAVRPLLPAFDPSLREAGGGESND